MLETLQQYMQYAEPIVEIIGWLAVLATLIVRVPAFKIKSEQADPYIGWIMKAMMWLPTLGINPNTSAMLRVMDEHKAKYVKPNS